METWILMKEGLVLWNQLTWPYPVTLAVDIPKKVMRPLDVNIMLILWQLLIIGPHRYKHTLLLQMYPGLCAGACVCWTQPWMPWKMGELLEGFGVGTQRTPRNHALGGSLFDEKPGYNLLLISSRYAVACCLSLMLRCVYPCCWCRVEQAIKK